MNVIAFFFLALFPIRVHYVGLQLQVKSSPPALSTSPVLLLDNPGSRRTALPSLPLYCLLALFPFDEHFGIKFYQRKHVLCPFLKPCS